MSSSSEEEELEPIISKSKRKKLLRLESEREKKKYRNELFEKLKKNALNNSHQTMMLQTSQMGQPQTFKQRLSSDLLKERMGMELDMKTSRLAVDGGISAGKWTRKGDVTLDIQQKT